MFLLCSQVDMPTQSQGTTLVSMFRGMGIEPFKTSVGRGAPPVGLYLKNIELS